MIKEQFKRNIGILSEKDMQQLQSTTIAIAGCGCIGGFSAELLTRMGIGKLILADPDIFDLSNINRQCAATYSTIGQPKAEALKTHLLSINPELEIKVYNEGVSGLNADAFLADADYVIDAIDYFSFSGSLALHRAARKRGLYVSTAAALGFGTGVLTFDPNGLTLEQYIGLPENLSEAEATELTFPASGYASSLPGYATEERVRSWLAERTIPAVSVGQALGPGVLVSRLVLHLLGRQMPAFAPQKFELQFEA
jgi:tRNA threonylcarbamoyladenosine dehydratase